MEFEQPQSTDELDRQNPPRGEVRITVWNLRYALAALAQRPGPRRFHGSLHQLFLFCILLWSLSAFDDFVDAGFVGRLSVWGIISDAALNYFWLVAIALVGLLIRNANIFLPLAVGTAAVSVVLSALWIPATYLWQEFSPASYQQFLTPAWWCLFGIEMTAFFRILSWYCPVHLVQRLMLSIIYTGTILFSIWYFPPQSMFFEPWGEGSANEPLNVEDVYYAQPNLMRQAVHQIADEEPGEVDVYHIGFAAYGEQDVFLHEVENALAILTDKFHSDGKTLGLINNRATVMNSPLATRHNLRRGIKAIAEKMNLDEDIMLVFLSSHGNEDGSISVHLEELGLSDLTASELRQSLDEPHVYWRIIIVSACFSGSFIDELKSPSTLIMTAAAADKSSFGCEHQRDWTYFGEAFFRQALPGNASLVDSFEAARNIINERERTEGKEASEPQIWIGETHVGGCDDLYVLEREGKLDQMLTD